MSFMHISVMIVWAEGEGESLSLILSLAGILCPLMLVLLPLMNYLGMSIMHDVHQLPDQLQNFRLQEAQCFCCSHHHRHPETGQELICDRELVYQTLTDLYSPSRRLGGGVKHFACFRAFTWKIGENCSNLTCTLHIFCRCVPQPSEEREW